jgi:hypothetical protein
VRVEEDAVLLKEIPIQFLWKTKNARKGEKKGGEVAVFGLPKRDAVAKRCATAVGNEIGDGHPWDPHKVGFGPLPDKLRRPPPVSQVIGILGKIPSERTRGGGSVEGGDGEVYQGGEGIGGEFPPLSQRDKDRCVSSSPSSLSAANPKAAAERSSPTSKQSSYQTQIDQFVGYFRSKRKTKPQSYAEAVRFETNRDTMVYPATNRGGGRREGFRAGRSGWGAGRTGGRTFIWQRAAGARGRDSAEATKTEEGRRTQEEVGGEEKYQHEEEEGEVRQDRPVSREDRSSSN